MNKKIFLALVVIILLAFILRFYKVTQIPPSLNWDEVSIGYNAYSILKTGKDEWGVSFPLHFKSYGEYKLPVHLYGSIPAIAIFGLNDFGVRITPVVYGTLTVLLMFFLSRALINYSQNKLFKSQKEDTYDLRADLIGLISAFLLAVSPWHIQLTRGSFESSFALFWIVLGVWLLVKGFSEHKWWFWSMLPLALAVYTYNSARIFVPLFLFFILLVFFKSLVKKIKIVLISIVFFMVLLLPLLPFILSGEGSARYKLVSVIDDPGLVPRINENRGLSQLPGPFPRLIHNKVTYATSTYISHYLAHFSPEFLFISGAPHKQHHVQGIGQMYIFQAPFILIGLIFLFMKKENFKWLIIGWMLLAYIPVAVTNDSIPHALRTLNAVPTYQFLTAVGIYYSLRWLQKKNKRILKMSYPVLLIIFFICFGVYLNQYYNVYPKLYSRDWQYGYQEVVNYIKDHQNEYDEIVFSRHYGEPHMFTLFYLDYDPAKFQNNPNLVRFESYGWIRVLRFDKFFFPDLGDEGTRFADITTQNPTKKLLFIGKPGDFPSDARLLKEVSFLDGNKAFEIVEVR